jgi:hypothetical protein
MDGMSPERLDAMLVLQASGEPLAPVEVAALLGKDRGSVKKLLRTMLADGQIVQPFRGVYDVPEREVTDEAASQADSVSITESAGTGELYSQDSGERGLDMPHPTHSPSGLYAYSEQDGGSIPAEVLRWRKGYR